MTLTGHVHEINWVRTSLPGWVSVVDDLYVALDALDVEVRVAQVKEKFGGLRFYYDLDDDVDTETCDAIVVLVDAAEKRTYEICQRCGGSPVQRARGYWVRYLCATCEPETPEERLARVWG